MNEDLASYLFLVFVLGLLIFSVASFLFGNRDEMVFELQPPKESGEEQKYSPTNVTLPFLIGIGEGKNEAPQTTN